MKWSSGTIDRIREAHDLVEWVNRDTVLKQKSQGQYFGLCPFSDHNEKTPSFSVSSVKQVYHCFGCQKGGDLFTYLNDQKGMNFVDAVQYLAQQAGIPLERDEEGSQQSLQRIEFFKINEKVSQVFHQALKKAPESVHTYLNQRGFSKETIKDFQLGYASPKGELLNFFKEAQHRSLLEKIGLIGRNNDSNFYEFFRNRLIFPIVSPMNKVLGFGARSLDGSLPKYINSRDSLCFQKRKMFYGLNQSAPHIRKNGYALIVEGYTDFLTLYQNGFKNVVAVLGTALTADHAQLLKRYTQKVVLFFDGDQAGSQAALRSLPILLEKGLRVHHVDLKGTDPDECIRKKGGAFFKTVISKNQDFFLHVFFEKLKMKKGADRLDVVREMHPILYRMKDEVLQEYYKRALLDAFTSVDQKPAQLILEKKPSQKVFSQDPQEKEPQIQKPLKKVSLTKLSRPEIYLLVLSLHELRYLDYVSQHLDLEILTNEGFKQLFEFIIKNYDENSENFDKFLTRVMARVEPEQWLSIHHHPVLKNLTGDQGLAVMQDCLTRLKFNYENSKIKNLTMQLKLNTTNDKKSLEEIKNMKKKLLSMENHYEK